MILITPSQQKLTTDAECQRRRHEQPEREAQEDRAYECLVKTPDADEDEARASRKLRVEDEDADDHDYDLLTEPDLLNIDETMHESMQNLASQS